MENQDLSGIWLLDASRRGGVDTDRLARENPVEIRRVGTDDGIRSCSEYGLGPEHMMRVAQYIPFETGFWSFRKSYREAIRSLKDMRFRHR